MLFDVAVVGASVAGSAVAALARARGLSVAVIEQRPRADLGRPGIRGLVPVWALEDARLPVGELVALPGRVHVVAGDARASVELPDCVLVDPGPLTASLLDRAVAEGATLVDGARVRGIDHDGVVTTRGPVPARIVVDASGARGARLLGELATSPRDVASIAYERRMLGDRAVAYSFLEALGAERGDTIAFLAPCGPGTAILVRMDEVVEIDALSFGADDGGPTARAVIRRFASSVGWIGDLLASEAEQIALGHVRGVVASDPIALVGSAAGGVRPTRGAELASGLLSARMLVEAIARGDGLAAYDARWHARFRRLAAFDATLARALRSVDEATAARLVRSGAIGERVVRAVCEQRVARLPALRLAGFAALQNGRRALASVLAPLAPQLRPALAGGPR